MGKDAFMAGKENSIDDLIWAEEEYREKNHPTGSVALDGANTWTMTEEIRSVKVVKNAKIS